MVEKICLRRYQFVEEEISKNKKLKKLVFLPPKRVQVSPVQIETVAFNVIALMLGTEYFNEIISSPDPSALDICQEQIADVFYAVLYRANSDWNRKDNKKMVKAHQHAACVRSVVSELRDKLLC
jgi:hypothetical protein